MEDKSLKCPKLSAAYGLWFIPHRHCPQFCGRCNRLRDQHIREEEESSSGGFFSGVESIFKRGSQYSGVLTWPDGAVSAMHSQLEEEIQVLQSQIRSLQRSVETINLERERQQSLVASCTLHEALFRVTQQKAMGRTKSIVLPNPVCATSQACYLFIKALVRLGYKSIRDLLDFDGHYVVGFHGTRTIDAIIGIFRDGFDPKRRSVQAYGQGEYFDMGEGLVSDTFCNTIGGCAIATLIVTKRKDGTRLPEYTYRDNYHGNKTKPICIVNNPLSSAATFCLPCAVVSAQQINLAVEKTIYEAFTQEWHDMALPVPRHLSSSNLSHQLLHYKDDSDQWIPLDIPSQVKVQEKMAQGETKFFISVLAESVTSPLVAAGPSSPDPKVLTITTTTTTAGGPSWSNKSPETTSTFSGGFPDEATGVSSNRPDDVFTHEIDLDTMVQKRLCENGKIRSLKWM